MSKKQKTNSSSAESRMYISYMKDNKDIVNNILLVCDIKGKLNHEKFWVAWDKIVKRQDNLRKYFYFDQKVKAVIIDKLPKYPKECIDAKIEELKDIKEKFITPFDLESVPLFNVLLVKIDENYHQFLLNIHHSIFDGLSLAPFLNDLLSFYSGENLPQLKYSYSDYVKWSKEFKNSKEYLQQKKYWQNKYKDFVSPMEFPYSFKARGEINSDGITRQFKFNREIFEKAKAVAHENKVTLYTLLYSVYCIMLAKYSRQDEIVTGIVLSGRTNPDTANLLGMFVNTMPLKCSVDDDEKYLTFLQKMSEEILGAKQNQEYQFDDLVDDLHDDLADDMVGEPANNSNDKAHVNVDDKAIIKTQTNKNPLFDFAFNLIRKDSLLKNDISISMAKDWHGNIVGKVHFDLNFQFVRDVANGDNLELFIEARKALFSEYAVKQLYTHFVNILTQITTNSNIFIKDLNIITETETDLILNVFNNTYTDYPREKTIVEIFEKYVKLYKNSDAVIYKEDRLTFAKLNKKVNQLARLLRRKGVHRESRVGIFLDRKIEVVVSMLAVLKAGGTYVPIDSKYPEDRITFMLEDSNCVVLLSESGLIDKIAYSKEYLDVMDYSIYSDESSKNLKHLNTPSDLACIIYTSGSTGQPKGVMIEHKNIINLSFYYMKMRNLRPKEAIAQHASFSFDAAIIGVFPVLFAGCSIHILSEEIKMSLLDINNYFTENNIKGCFFTTQLGEQYMENYNNPKLNFIEVGGEKLKKYIHRQYLFINGYGPTENTTYTTNFILDKNYDNIPLGKPLDNTKIYIVDKNMNLCPVGIPGELCISGENLSRGYLNRPELTSEKFISNIFASEKERKNGYDRLYKTGDLVRWLPDGNLEFSGRIDFQVKIRGFRIELGEIEARLNEFPQINDAVVLALDDSNGTKYLCGYYTVSLDINTKDINADIEREKIKSYLGESLPDYMIPNIYIKMDSFPLTPNGKINRKILPLPEVTDLSVAEYIAPQNENEKIIASVWGEVLGIEKIGINDNFFDLGGSSIKAINLVSKLQAKGYTLKIKSIFDKPTIFKLSQDIQLSSDKFLSILPVGKQPYYAVSGSQRGMYLTDKMGDMGTTYNVPTIIDITGKLNWEKFGLAIDCLVNQHEVLRTSFDVIKGVIVQKIHKHIEYKKEFAKVSHLNLQFEIENFIKKFDLKKAPLFRIKLFKLNKEKHLLVFDFHHIIFDGGSVKTLIDDLMSFYDGMKLEALNLQYKDYAQWEVENKNSEAYKNRENYWIDRLSGDLPIIELPLDYIRKKEWNYKGDVVNFTVDKSITKELNKLANQQNVTLYSVFLAAFNVLLNKYSRQDDIIIGTPLSGRTRPEVQSMIGMFVNTLPFRSNIVQEESFEKLLLDVNNSVIDMLSNQEYPFSELVEKLGIRSEAGHNPIYDVVFNYLKEEKFDNRVKVLHPEESNSAKFDILLSVEEKSNFFKLSFNYKTSLFSEKTIKRFKDNFLKVLDIITQDPLITIKNIDIISKKEKNIILHSFNDITIAYPVHKTVIELFDEIALKYPDNIAVVYKDRKYSYAELAEITEFIGAKLRKLGVNRDKIVPISVERSENIIIGVLSINKAGGGYIFIDPTQPKNRQDFIINDCEAKVILIDSKLKGNYSSLEIIENELSFKDLLAEYRSFNGKISQDRINCPEDIFGIITTSGSTGEPKGTMIENRNFVNFAYYYNNLMETVQGDRVASYASFSFDVSVATNFAPLLCGATVHIIPSDIRLGINELASYFNVNDINVTFLPTPIGELYIKEIDKSPLKTMAIGGEQLKTFTKRSYRVINAYSPSECTIAVLMGDVDENNLDKIPLGEVQPNNRVYIFDEGMNLCPIGIAGELYIGGDQVGRGYYKRADITAERFIIHEKYGRLYRSGDLAKWLDDGQVVYLGRIDFQVKVSGFRIELGAIENKMVEIERIEDAVVLALNDSSNNKFLCGYYTSKFEIHKETIKAELFKSLPEYMIPNIFIKIDAFKLTPNGKINRKILPVPEVSEVCTVEYKVPESEVEKTFASVWAEVLGLEKVGVKDDFYDLGGSSIKAIALVSKLQKLGFNVSMSDFLKNSTIELLSSSACRKDYDLKEKFSKIKAKILNGVEERKSVEFTKLLDSSKKDYLLKNKKYDNLDISKCNLVDNVLLTGATGYLGIHILKELIETGSTKIYCIIRGKDYTNVLERLKKKIEYYFGEKFIDCMKDRVVVYSGDLSEKLFGLEQNNYNFLVKNIDSIIHTAANVGHYGEYDVFYNANVLPVIKLAEFAGKEKLKDLHYISTRSVCDAVNISDSKFTVISEYDDITQMNIIDNVYIRTKLEGEAEILKARNNGINANIYRVGNLVFNSQTGKHQENLEDNAFYQTIKTYINLGYVPDIIDVAEMSYVDYTAKAICLLYNKKELKNEIFHVYSSKISVISKMLCDDLLNINVCSIKFDSFIEYLYENYDRAGFDDYIEKLMFHTGWLNEETEKTFVAVLQDKTETILKSLGFNWAKIKPVDFINTIKKAFSHRVKIVSKQKLASGLNDNQLYDLSKRMKLNFLKKDSVIFSEGSQSNKIYFIIEGMLTESKKSYGGWDGILRFLSDNTVVGVENINTLRKNNVTVESIIKDVLFLEIDITDFKNIMMNNKNLLENVFNMQFEEKDKLKRMIVAMN